MLCSVSACAVYSYSASTYLSFLAPLLGATAGPFFRTAGADVPIEEPLFEYVDAGRPECCGASAAGAEASTYAVGTRPSL